jgi:oxygen-independent coproporphyrinogen-3 oxidase
MIPEALKERHEAYFWKDEANFYMKVTSRKSEYEFSCRKQEDDVLEYQLVVLKSALLKLYNKNYKWGGLIGVRPTKVYRKLLAYGYEHKKIKEILQEVYLVSSKKAELLEIVVKKEMEYLNRDYINVYIGVPYCPTKCRYCSFASYEVRGRQGEAYGDFVETLIEEIRLSGEFLSEIKLPIESIYMGGGTPTILSEEDLDRVLTEVNGVFDKSFLKEFTVEAGRIDTLNSAKLLIMKRHGVDRISINPQTFNEDILKELNRYFDRKEFDEIYDEAKKIGFTVNIDLIIGLPNEDTEKILYTLEELKNYDIDNLTIHVLALKKASVLFKEGYEHKEVDYELINTEIEKLAKEKDLYPYYMYRQKNSLDWGENLGYSKKGKESVFNIEMIEENQSTFGIGGGAISKVIIAEGNKDNIERIVNPKEPIAYINEMKDRFNKKSEMFIKAYKK